MGRLIFFAIIALLAYWILRRVAMSKKAPPEKHYTSVNDAADTVRCSVCGVYMPREEALMSKGAFYCESHRPDRHS
ncbi:PP0621 family protein [Leeia speluncae]|uniref:PP0621 family protein n=1 Tax=Leeia speluncae TaxID=2884804 RepID=UPI003571794D